MRSFFLISGHKEGALLYLNKFKWGKTFVNINEELLDKYSACKSSTDVVEVQNLHLQMLEEESQADRGRCEGTDMVGRANIV